MSPVSCSEYDGYRLSACRLGASGEVNVHSFR